tara:strand:+ start:273 stop:827 length:555 start_codon:yes stop_codon:yes gene_type:complete
MLIFFSVCASLEFNISDHFIVDFDVDCSEFFILKGKEDYAYFHRKNSSLELWITRNESYEIYNTDMSARLSFEWPTKLVNEFPMELVLFEGVISQPYHFDTSYILCKTLGYAKGTLLPKRLPWKDVVYKSQIKQRVGKLYYAIAFLAFALVGSFVFHAEESIRALFRSEIPRILQRGSSFLSRS